MAKTRTQRKNEKGATGAEGKEKQVVQSAARAPAEAAEPAAPAKPRVGPFRFLQQVRQETSRVTWPTRKETMVTSVMVFVMVILCALFFLLVDEVLGTAVRYVLHLVG